MSGMLNPIKNNAMVDVPGRGLVDYGNLNPTFLFSQTLTTLDGNWTTGPALFASPVDYGFGQCIVQVFYFIA